MHWLRFIVVEVCKSDLTARIVAEITTSSLKNMGGGFFFSLLDWLLKVLWKKKGVEVETVLYDSYIVRDIRWWEKNPFLFVNPNRSLSDLVRKRASVGRMCQRKRALSKK